ncbi:MAG: pyruvate kinase [Deltaproteobacteria bacterium]|nr:pyruvate kinase [Deltaproteobacteria bacterium]MBW2537313.1 pyruvate kinase [Deltaproteobacteria bacterium]
MVRRTKIVSTLGPATDTQEVVAALIEAGLDVARLNTSHGSHDEHARRIALVRQEAERLHRPVAILLDLPGLKIRTGRCRGGGAVADGDRVTLVEGSDAELPQIAIDHPGFAEGLSEGDQVLLDDGRIALRVERTGPVRADCVVDAGGALRDRMGVHLPARSVRAPSWTDQDREHLEFGLAQDVDYVAVSFVRCAEEIHRVRQRMAAAGSPVPIVAKIETPQAVDDIERIVQAADAVMVARGDLGVEFSPETVPVLQRRIVAAAKRQLRPVIVATEMLQSMITARRPTRAEASDVAHAVFDGADAVMLSAETAVGHHPPRAIQTMARIVVEAERFQRGKAERPHTAARGSLAESVAFNAADVAEETSASAIVAFTRSGRTARLVSQARSPVPVVALSPDAHTCRRMALLWGVEPRSVDELSRWDELRRAAEAQLVADERIEPGDRFVVVFGAPVGSGAETNSLCVFAAG